MARILIVDDSKEILDLAKMFLSDSGHEVLTAANAMDAMELLNTYRIDLGIFDIEMPYTNGFQLSETLKNSMRYKFFPIVFMTGRKEKKDVERAMKVKAEGYILKPIEKDKLNEAIDFVINKISPSKYPNVEISKTVLSENAQVIKKEPIKIKSISDVGLLAESTNRFKIDEVLELNSSLFHEVGIPPVAFRVANIREMVTGIWEVKLVFIGLNYESVQKLRSWILSQDIKNIAS
ncbi:MAG: response regulator [Bdellovibrionota bacterium]